MKIHTNSSDRLIAQLDKADMERYDIAFGSLELDDEKPGRLISDLLSVSGISLNGRSCRLNVDAVSNGENGMYIILTLTDTVRRTKRLRIRNRRYVCALFSREDLFPLCDALKRYEAVITDCRLYSDGENYAVEICQSVLDKINLKHVLSEFGLVRSCPARLRRAELDEHYRLICDDFIRRLSP